MEEIWKDIQGYEGIYMISSYGNIKSYDKLIKCRNNKYRLLKSMSIKPVIKNNGYFFVSLTKNKIHTNLYVHRLVAKSFIKNTLNLL